MCWNWEDVTFGFISTIAIFSFAEDASLTIVRRSSSKRDQFRNRNTQGRVPAIEPADSSLQLERRLAADQDADNDEDELVEMQSGSITTSTDEIDDVDLATDNLPAVDTPDACDKAALR